MTSRPRRRLGGIAAAAALVVATGCVGERERLDVPSVALDVAAQTPEPGGRVTGRATASDESGLISLAIYACTQDSVFRTSDSYDRQRTAEIDFSLHVASTAVVEDPVEIYAVAFDDQGFAAEASLTLHVGRSGSGPGSGLCTRLRPAASRALPTAPRP